MSEAQQLNLELSRVRPPREVRCRRFNCAYHSKERLKCNKRSNIMLDPKFNYEKCPFFSFRSESQ